MGPDALAYLLERTGHYPFFIQTYRKYAWQIAPSSPIDMTAAHSARRAGRSGGHTVSRFRFVKGYI